MTSSFLYSFLLFLEGKSGVEVSKCLGLAHFDAGTCQNLRVCSGGGKEPKPMKYVLDGDNDEEEPEKEDLDFEPEDEEDP
jgi:hypothetical protein